MPDGGRREEARLWRQGGQTCCSQGPGWHARDAPLAQACFSSQVIEVPQQWKLISGLTLV